MNFLNFQFNKKPDSLQNRGLTLVETLVAISILTIAVIGPLGIIGQALHSSYYTKDQMTAYYLAQEPIEYVRNLRDNQGIAITKDVLDNTVDTYTPPFWLQGVVGGFTTVSGEDVIGKIVKDGGNLILNAGNLSSNHYSLNNDNGVYSFSNYDDNSYLKTDTNGIFGVTTGTDSIFKREIYFQRTLGSVTGDPQEFVMVVNVTWKNGAYPAKLTLREYFTNWTSKTGS